MTKLKLVVVVQWAAIVLGSPVFASEIPDILYQVDDPGGPPGWVSKQELDVALEESGRSAGSRLEAVGHLFLRQHRLPSSLEAYRNSKAFRMTPKGEIAECEPQLISYYPGEQAKSLGHLFDLAQAVLKVRVVASKAGFLSAQAGTLLEAQVSAVLKGTDAFDLPSDFLYLFHRYARMVIDGSPLCLGRFPVYEGEFLLFLLWEPGRELGAPVYFLDGGALVSPRGQYFGSLLHPEIDPKELERQFAEADFIEPKVGR